MYDKEGISYYAKRIYEWQNWMYTIDSTQSGFTENKCQVQKA